MNAIQPRSKSIWRSIFSPVLTLQGFPTAPLNVAGIRPPAAASHPTNLSVLIVATISSFAQAP
ncbi:hypothetical protein [Lysobacter gummosus]|uniref:hypothetical protein n=1 Tax=Lysobacter gummosus TaxID=262324 RepID=UPI00363950E6